MQTGQEAIRQARQEEDIKIEDTVRLPQATEK